MPLDAINLTNLSKVKVAPSFLRLTIQENAILELQHGKSTLAGEIDGLSDDHILVLEEIRNRMDNRTNDEIAALANLKGISDDQESIRKSKNVIVSQLVNDRVMEFKIGNENYAAWFDQNVLNLQMKSRRASSQGLLQVNNSILDETKHIFHAAVLHAYKESSIYKREYGDRFIRNLKIAISVEGFQYK